MTEAAAEASELASVSGARPGDAVAGDLPVWHLASLAGFAEWSAVLAERVIASRTGGSAAASFLRRRGGGGACSRWRLKR